MSVLYNALLLSATVLMLPVLCLLLVFRRKYRSGFVQKCGKLPKQLRDAGTRPRPIWVHAVSVGEVMAAVPLLKEMKKRFPESPLMLSTVTETGHFTALQHAGAADTVMYFPFDFPFIVRPVVRRVMPRAFITLETEIWPNFLFALRRHAIPAMIVSGRISPSSYKSYSLFRVFFRLVLACVNSFCMQTRTDARRIIGMGALPERVHVTGSIKFDQQIPAITPQEKQGLYRDLRIDREQNVLIAGSTHRGEESIVLDVFTTLKQSNADLVLILAPRHPERFAEAEDLLKRQGCRYVKRSAIRNADTPFDIILLDTIGELSKIYSLGTIIFIGGSMVAGVGGHNVLEPAVFCKPVLFGPHMTNFAEIASDLIHRDAAVQVNSRDEFIAAARALLEDPQRCRRIGETAFSVIERNSGAVKTCIDMIDTMLKNNPR